jgi:thiamine biosynthesis lipoprotein
LSLLLLFLSSCASTPKPIENARAEEPLESLTLTRPTMGTLVSVTAWHKNRAGAAQAVEAAFAAIERINKLAGTHHPESEVNRFNVAPVNTPFPLSPETEELFARAFEYSKISGGVFDATVRPLILLWRRGQKTGLEPTASEWDAAQRAVGADKFVLDRAAHAATRLVAEAGVDFGGIAKGYAADQALKVMRVAGAAAGIVQAGGDVGTFGRRPQAADGLWRVGLQHPREPEQFLTRFKLPPGKSASTSGDYERFFLTNEKKRLCHILDPRTARPASGTISATIVTDNSTAGDALATAVFILGPKDGMALVERLPGVEALIVDEDRRIFRSKGFAAMEFEE